MVLAPLTASPVTEESWYYGIHGMGVFQCKLRLTRLLSRQSRMNPNRQEMKTGPPPQVGQHIPVIILGRKNLMIAAAEKIPPLREEVPTRLSTLKGVKYLERGQCCVGVFLHYMPWDHRIRMMRMQAKEIDRRRQGNWLRHICSMKQLWRSWSSELS